MYGLKVPWVAEDGVYRTGRASGRSAGGQDRGGGGHCDGRQAALRGAQDAAWLLAGWALKAPSLGVPCR